jgi:protein-tyrosine phosphatase
MVGHAIHEYAARVLEELGGDPSNFAGRRLMPRVASDADLVITMTRAHRDAVLEIVPQRLRTTFTLSEISRIASEFDAQTIADLAALRPRLATRELRDIPDPIGRNPEFFSMVGSQIAGLLPPVLSLCQRLSVPTAD